MSIESWWWEFEARQQEARDLQEQTKHPPKFRGPKWDEARRKHKERMRAKNGASGNPSG